MSKMLAGLGGNAGAVVAGGGMVVVLALGAYIGFGSDLSPKDDPVVKANELVSQTIGAKPKDETERMAPKEVTAEVMPKKNAPIAAPQSQKPSFDELRREEDGTTIIAGRAEPLSDVKILVDGDEVATTKADSQGGFAAITVLPAGDSAQVVSLSSQGDGAGDEENLSLDEIILAPSKDAVAVVTATVEEVTATPDAGQIAKVAPEIEAASETEVVANLEAQPTETVRNIVRDPETVTESAAEPERIAVLKSDETGVSLLNPVQPDAMTSIALDTIGYSDLGAVQLTGRAQPDTARVRVYLDNRSIVSLPVDAKGRWRGDLPEVDEGVYTLRVDEVRADGKVSSRVETPFKRESAETLAEASTSEGPIKSITVQAGATLWAIARDRYGDGTLYLRVFEANAKSIRDPDLIYPGQVFDLPN